MTWMVWLKPPVGGRVPVEGLTARTTFGDLRSHAARKCNVPECDLKLEVDAVPRQELVLTDAVPLKDVLTDGQVVLVTSRSQSMLDQHAALISALPTALPARRRRGKRKTPVSLSDAPDSSTSSISLEEALVTAAGPAERASVLDHWQRSSIRTGLHEYVVTQYDLTRAAARVAAVQAGRHVFQQNENVRRLSDGSMPVVTVRFPAAFDDLSSSLPCLSDGRDCPPGVKRKLKRKRKWMVDHIQLMEPESLQVLIQCMQLHPNGLTMLKPYNLARELPTVFWTIVKQHGPDVAAALSQLSDGCIDATKRTRLQHFDSLNERELALASTSTSAIT